MRRIGAVVGVGALALLAAAGLWRFHKSRTVQSFGTLVARVDTRDSVVALTLDDGPVHAAIDTVVEVLERARIPATFFLVGGSAARHPEDVRRLIALGHEPGNHSYSHPVFLFRSPSFIAGEIERTDSVLRAAGWRGAIHFRPPYGKKLVGLPYYLWRTGRTTITWDVEPDSYPGIAGDAARMVDYAVRTVRPGSIILLHPWGARNAADRAAIPLLAEALQRRGYRFVTVSALLAAGGAGGGAATRAAVAGHRRR